MQGASLPVREDSLMKRMRPALGRFVLQPAGAFALLLNHQNYSNLISELFRLLLNSFSISLFSLLFISSLSSPSRASLALRSCFCDFRIQSQTKLFRNGASRWRRARLLRARDERTPNEIGQACEMHFGELNSRQEAERGDDEIATTPLTSSCLAPFVFRA